MALVSFKLMHLEGLEETDNVGLADMHVMHCKHTSQLRLRPAVPVRSMMVLWLLTWCCRCTWLSLGETAVSWGVCCCTSVVHLGFAWASEALREQGLVESLNCSGRGAGSPWYILLRIFRCKYKIYLCPGVYQLCCLLTLVNVVGNSLVCFLLLIMQAASPAEEKAEYNRLVMRSSVSVSLVFWGWVQFWYSFSCTTAKWF